jgi:hypothetical protein
VNVPHILPNFRGRVAPLSLFVEHYVGEMLGDQEDIFFKAIFASLEMLNFGDVSALNEQA